MDLNNTAWRKSSYSGAEGDNCVELASTPCAVAIRDSKAPEAGHLTMSRDEFARLGEAVKAL
ncbi:DUF397 domain-containing protein [Actinomadura hibisca]|uniref:DUF397 domain-containing protein n=1 Tax=Actinomadura hibisca TaxID=68565 RepID=UPI000A0148A3|nr:DUF397 domain-containing protein [Actinomadura hibisca]